MRDAAAPPASLLGRLRALWGDRTHHLDRMTLRDLTVAYFLYPAVMVYIVLLALAGGLALRLAMGPAWRLGLSALAAGLMYPAAWYLLHRFVLHGRVLYRQPWTAALWKRIHYDHHRDPNDLRVLFGALYTTLPTIAAATLPAGALIGGAPGAAAAFAGGVGCTLFYEFCHCVQHLRYTPRSRLLRRMKRLHLLHHFHSERGNYGITNFFWDRVAGTYYEQAGEVPRSESVFNLGYVGAERARYPWVVKLSEPEGHPR